MKPIGHSHKMRWLAGLVYGLFALYQLITLQRVLTIAGISGLPVLWLLEFLMAVPAVVAALWLLTGDGPVQGGIRRGAVLSTGLYIAFELLFYQQQAAAIDETIKDMSPSLSGNMFAQYILIIIRVALVILAAFFVLNSKARPASPEESEEELLEGLEDWTDTEGEAALLDEAPTLSPLPLVEPRVIEMVAEQKVETASVSTKEPGAGAATPAKKPPAKRSRKPKPKTQENTKVEKAEPEAATEPAKPEPKPEPGPKPRTRRKKTNQSQKNSDKMDEN